MFNLNFILIIICDLFIFLVLSLGAFFLLNNPITWGIIGTLFVIWAFFVFKTAKILGEIND